MDDLSNLFAPSSAQFAGIPLVMLIDDAQFADRDPALATFVEKLIARSAVEKWPLLLMITHWSRQLNEWRDMNDAEHPRSRIAQVLNSAQGVSLATQNYTEIDLGEPVDDLAPALVGQFPGINLETINLIVNKSGGNPRKLEQIAARMHAYPVWFEKNDIEKNDKALELTDEGREAVFALSDLPIDDLVLERLGDTAPAVRRSLLLASVMGSRFIVDLVDRMAEARFQNGARDDLEEGERKYRFVRDVVDRSRNDIASFSERLFSDAAKAYRERGLARQELEGWPDETDLYAALDSLLADMVDDPYCFDGLSDDDRAHALSVSADRMQLNGSAKAGLALAQLVRIENRRGNPEGAYDAAQQFIAGFATSE